MAKQKIFFIGDTHFSHKNILQFCPESRPFSSIKEHDETIVELWNSTVSDNDIVYHLGDVAFGGADNLRYVKYLNGTKHLIMGNHDHYRIMDYVEAGFIKIQGVMKYKEFVLSHVPLHPDSMRWGYNIHGHIHDASQNINDPRYINVNADVQGLIPRSLDSIRLAIQETVS
jgi:calcineurin-like phosphoesterase family protein